MRIVCCYFMSYIETLFCSLIQLYCIKDILIIQGLRAQLVFFVGSCNNRFTQVFSHVGVLNVSTLKYNLSSNVGSLLYGSTDGILLCFAGHLEPLKVTKKPSTHKAFYFLFLEHLFLVSSETFLLPFRIGPSNSYATAHAERSQVGCTVGPSQREGAEMLYALGYKLCKGLIRPMSSLVPGSPGKCQLFVNEVVSDCTHPRRVNNNYVHWTHPYQSFILGS